VKNKTDMLEGLKQAVAREKIKNAVFISGFGSVTSYRVHVVATRHFLPRRRSRRRTDRSISSP